MRTNELTWKPEQITEPPFCYIVKATIAAVSVVGDWIETGGVPLLVGVEVSNATGGQALTDFAVEFAPYPADATTMNSNAVTLLSGADYATSSDTMPFCTTTTPNTLAAASISNFYFRTRAAYAFRFKATPAGASSVVTVRGQAVME